MYTFVIITIRGWAVLVLCDDIKKIIYIINILLGTYTARAGRKKQELRGPELLWHRTREISDCRGLAGETISSWGQWRRRRWPEVFFRNRLPDGRNSRHVSPFSVTTCEKSHTMGCGTSNVETGRGRIRADKELYLPSTELHFNAGQMQRLNDNFLRGYENSGKCEVRKSNTPARVIGHPSDWI